MINSLKKTYGLTAILVSQLIVIGFGGLFLIISIIFNEGNFESASKLTSVLLSIISAALIFLTLLGCNKVFKINYTGYVSNNDWSVNLIYPVGIIFILLSVSIDFHVLGSEAKMQSNPPFVEGFLEILMRYIIPSIFFVYFTQADRQKKLKAIFLILLVLYTLYIDIYLKQSKHVALTYILLYVIYSIVNQKLISFRLLITMVIAILLTAYVFLSRTLGLDVTEDLGYYVNSELISQMANAIYARTVGLPETALMVDKIPVIQLPPEVQIGYSISNTYTQFYYGIPLGSGTSNATGFLGFHLFNFGWLGLIMVVPTSVMIFFVYYIATRIEGYKTFSVVAIDLFVIYLLVDGTLDERLYSAFILKFMIIIYLLIGLSIIIKNLRKSPKVQLRI